MNRLGGLIDSLGRTLVDKQGKRKTVVQHLYDNMNECFNKLKADNKDLKIIGKNRNSYFKKFHNQQDR